MAEDLEQKSAQEIIKWALETYQNRVALASSFGAEDVVLIDMLVKVSKENNLGEVEIFTLDTGRLPGETYNLMDKIREKYGVNLEVYFPDTKSVEDMVYEYGFNLFYNSIDLRKLCCKVRKVDPLNRALKGLDAWICGLRKEQSVTRAEVKKAEFPKDGKGIVKINPLADWTEPDVWDYIRKNDVPYNELHDKSYPSIGCEPCTRAVKPGEDVRAGRWWWETPDKKECGLHCGK
ncbi:MAG: phosphoadenylyl-sulfate reductase [bacterium]